MAYITAPEKTQAIKKRHKRIARSMPKWCCRSIQRGATIPVSLHGLGVEGGQGLEVLPKAVQQVASQVHLVPHLQGPHRANLELPLPWHHLSVDTRDDQARLHKFKLLPQIGNILCTTRGQGRQFARKGGQGRGMGTTQRRGPERTREGQNYLCWEGVW